LSIALRCRHGRNRGAKKQPAPDIRAQWRHYTQNSPLFRPKAATMRLSARRKSSLHFLAVDSKQYVKNIEKWNCKNLGKTA